MVVMKNRIKKTFLKKFKKLKLLKVNMFKFKTIFYKNTSVVMYFQV